MAQCQIFKAQTALVRHLLSEIRIPYLYTWYILPILKHNSFLITINSYFFNTSCLSEIVASYAEFQEMLLYVVYMTIYYIKLHFQIA